MMALGLFPLILSDFLPTFAIEFNLFYIFDYNLSVFSFIFIWLSAGTRELGTSLFTLVLLYSFFRSFKSEYGISNYAGMSLFNSIFLLEILVKFI